MASDWEGLVFAPGDTMFTEAPTWERIDTGVAYDAGCRVARIDIDRGRQDELDKTDTGTMTVTLNDRAGVFDPSNTGSPYYGLMDRKPIAFAVRDPVTDEWWPRYRGVIDEYGYGLSPTQVVGQTAIRCVDWFDYLNGFQLAPGHGDYVNATVNPSGFIVYAATDFQTRVEQIWEDASIPPGLSTAFTGNVDMQESKFSPGESVLAALLEASDAEFPSVAQGYCDKAGWLVWHGRQARFTPDIVAAGATHWDFNRWKAGDGTAIALDSDRAQIRPPFGFTRSMSRIYNAALAYPQGMDRSLMAAQILTSPGSIATYGTRSWSAENLRIEGGFTTGLTGQEECVLFEQYMLDNYAVPRDRIEQISFRPLHPDDPRAGATWALMSRVDISDIVNVRIDHPGGGGFNEDQYVEGLRETYTPLHLDLDTGYPNVEMTLNLSPASYWADGSAFD